jgi:hypothetical protein
MRKAILLFVCVLGLNTVNAQDFEKGGNYVTIGYGLDPWGHHVNNGNAWGNAKYRKTSIGPSILTYERGVTDVLGIGRIGAGGGIAHSIYTQKWTDNNYEYKDVRQRISFIARVAYHFEFDIEKMDVYAGVGAALHHYTDSEKDNIGFIDSRNTSIGLGHYVFAGIRYYFTDVIGVYAEAGHGLAALNGGLVFKF